MSVAALLRAANYLRRSPARAGGSAGHKEWLHFCVRDEALDLLVNFSACDDVEASAPAGAERAQVTALAHDRGGWSGDVVRHWESDAEIGGGSLALRIGENRLELTDDGFRVSVRLRHSPLEAHLVLVPETFPSLAHNVRLAAGQSLSWLVVPRLRASGVVRLADRTHRVHDALAYHDHNWGRFAWGADFAWEWGYGLPVDPACPWSFMFVRLSDRAMTSTKTQALTIWRGSEIVRSFRGRELTVSAEGHLRADRPFKVPPVAGLLAPGTATEVPDALTVVADANGDRLRITFRPSDVSQVVVPNDGIAGVTIVNEAAARLQASGRLLDSPFEFEGRGMLEVLAS